MNQYEQLEEKMNTEFDTYRDWLLTQPPEEILNHAKALEFRDTRFLHLRPKQGVHLG